MTNQRENTPYEPLKLHLDIAMPRFRSFRDILNKVSSFSYLDEEEQRLYGMYWRDHQDEKALERLVYDQTLTAAKTAFELYRKHPYLDLDELMDIAFEKMIGLVRAWDPEHPSGRTLGSFVKGFLTQDLPKMIPFARKDYLWQKESVGKIESKTRKALGNHDYLNQDSQATPPDVSVFNDVATEQNVPLDTVISVYKGVHGRTVSADERMINTDWPENPDLYYNPNDTGWLQDEWEPAHHQEIDPNIEPHEERLWFNQMTRELIDAMRAKLNEREIHILFSRRLKKEPLDQLTLAKEYNVSRERIRQIEIRAFEKVQTYMRRKFPSDVFSKQDDHNNLYRYHMS